MYGLLLIYDRFRYFTGLLLRKELMIKAKEGAGNHCGSVLTLHPGSLNMELNSDVNFSFISSYLFIINFG